MKKASTQNFKLASTQKRPHTMQACY